LSIPASLEAEIGACSPLDVSNRAPLFVSNCDTVNPDEFSFAIYEDYSNQSREDNIRATMITEVLNQKTVIEGDVFLVCPEDLALRFLENDQRYQQQIA